MMSGARRSDTPTARTIRRWRHEAADTAGGDVPAGERGDGRREHLQLLAGADAAYESRSGFDNIFRR